MPLPPLRPPIRRLVALLALVRTLPAAAILAPTLLLGNLLQMLSVVTLPFSRRLFRTINRNIAAAWWGGCVHLARCLHGVKVVVTGDELPRGENAVVMVNHQSMSDIPVILDVASRHRRLGDLKWYVKDVVKYVPGIGWGMLFLDCLFIKRDWTEDRDKIARVFRSIVKGRAPVWIVSFLEGTRIRPAKLLASQEFARTKLLPVMRHVLVPRTKGFVATLEGLKGHVHAVYDFTI
ncbi:MAG: lysophospholipid acyltransferase family protein, partial [Deltaproteobacteria bacterium]|nr:lysophospholipid acyltransferase family protein [Deltaproteobacteria bacterium]